MLGNCSEFYGGAGRAAVLGAPSPCCPHRRPQPQYQEDTRGCKRLGCAPRAGLGAPHPPLHFLAGLALRPLPKRPLLRRRGLA